MIQWSGRASWWKKEVLSRPQLGAPVGFREKKKKKHELIDLEASDCFEDLWNCIIILIMMIISDILSSNKTTVPSLEQILYGFMNME